MRHDIMLRRALKEMRGGEWSGMHSLRYWLITNNNALLRFDAVAAKNSSGYPVCVQPLTFLQMLRLSTPRSEGWDRATISSIRILLVQMGGPGKLDQAATRVLAALARYGHRGLNEEQLLSSVLTEEIRRLAGHGADGKHTFVAEESEAIRQEVREISAAGNLPSGE